MPKIIGWRAWYEGRRTFDSASTRWADLPATGVIGFVEYEDTLTPARMPTRRIVANGDYFWMDEKTRRIQKTATSDVRDSWVAKPDSITRERLKAGLWISDAEYARAQSAMVNARKAPA